MGAGAIITWGADGAEGVNGVALSSGVGSGVVGTRG